MTSFFIATAESQYWPAEGTLVFANGWLLPASEIPLEYRNLQISLSLKKKQELFEQTETIYQSVLVEVVNVLNTYHSTTKSKRYWEIIVGVWLRMLIESVATRTIIVQSILEKDSDTRIVNSPNSLSSSASQCLQDFQANLKSDVWNADVYARIMEILKGDNSQAVFMSTSAV
ncbi:MAG: hypothetical protein ACOVLJ_07750, partial [Ilumatobacteraceae bacterium]